MILFCSALLFEVEKDVFYLFLGGGSTSTSPRNFLTHPSIQSIEK